MKKLLLFYIFFPFCVKAATYYVSSSTGNDSRTSAQAQNPSTPWASITKLNSYINNIHAGDTIKFKCGDTFNIPEGVNTGGFLISVSGTITQPVVITSYGTGAKPVITLPPITGFTGSGVYTASWTIQSCCSILYEDGIPLTKATSSSCTDGNWYGASGTLYYKPTSATPSSHTVTVANINNSYIPAIDLSNQQYITVNGLQINSVGIGIKTFETSHGTRGLKIQNCTFNYCQSGIFMMPDTGGNTNCTIQNNLFYRCQVGVRLYAISAVGGIYAARTTGSHTSCIIYNNEMSQCGTTNGTMHWQSSIAGTDYEAIGLQNFTGGNISNNYIHDGYCIALSWYNLATRSSSNNLFQFNRIFNNQKGAIILTGDAGYNYAYNNNIFSNNLIVNSNGAPGNNDGTIAIYQGTAATVNNKFINNTLSGPLNNIAFETSHAPYFTIQNNIVYNVGSNNFVAYGFSTKPASLTMDYNLYYSATNWIMGSNKTLTGVHALGLEQHSITADPLFVNPGAYAYQLQNTSPAINAGINVGLSFSGIAPDMGYTEYVVPVVTPSGGRRVRIKARIINHE